MSSVLADKPIENFIQPNNAILSDDVSPVIKGCIPDNKDLKIDKFSGKLITEHTPEIAIIEKTFKDMHSILHYINKNNPLGPKPSNPGSDYQYDAWEKSIVEWASKQTGDNINIDIAPTEFDDVHTPENEPSIEILGLNNNQKIITPDFYINAIATAPRGVSVVEYWVDDNLIGITKNPPYNFHWTVNTSNGMHRIKVVAYDDVFNKGEDFVDVNINISGVVVE